MNPALSFISERFSSFVMSFGRGFLLVLFITFFVAALLPEVRTTIRESVFRENRTVISAVHGDITGNGDLFTVAKVRTRDSISLEIYHHQADGSQRIANRISLPEKKDGFFNFNGQATNLAIDDIDGDGIKEVIVPVFDQNMVGHLHIYHFDADSQSFRESKL